MDFFQETDCPHNETERKRMKTKEKINTSSPETHSNSGRPTRKLCLIGALVLVLVIGIFLAAKGGSLGGQKQPEMITASSLKEVIQVSKLSTYGAAYNGIARVLNPDDPEKIDYYVSYDSDVKVGMDLNQIQYDIDEASHSITITLPKMELQAEVDIASLDYIFLEADAETGTVSQQAYGACIADVEAECQEEQEIFLLARTNAEKIVNALIEPLFSGMEQEYSINIEWEV